MRRIVVTGAAQGIGKAISETLLKEPLNKIIVIDKQETAYIKESLKTYPSNFEFYLQDVADRDSLSRVLKTIAEQPIYGIVNNAGEVYLEKWDELKLNTWDRTIAVNVSGPLQIIHELSSSVVEGGAVVNIASVDGLCAAYDTIAYGVSKAALINLTKSLAAILGEKGIRVNAVAPGWVETEMTQNTLPPEATYMTPLNRNATAVDVANVVEFLLSSGASFISGETIVVDGGLTIVDYTLKKESEHNSSS